jgi:hypothetical protein
MSADTVITIVGIVARTTSQSVPTLRPKRFSRALSGGTSGRWVAV